MTTSMLRRIGCTLFSARVEIKGALSLFVARGRVGLLLAVCFLTIDRSCKAAAA
jgi:hypothetical protein